MMVENWEKFVDKAMQNEQAKHPQKAKEKGVEYSKLMGIISKVAVDHDLQPSARLAIIQLIARDGLQGGRISINTVKKLIGSPSTQTALSVLKALEEREIIVRVRSRLGSKYTFTDKFLNKVTKRDASTES